MGIGMTGILEPINGFILDSEKYYITKLNNIYLYRNDVMIDGYLLVYEKDKYYTLKPPKNNLQRRMIRLN